MDTEYSMPDEIVELIQTKMDFKNAARSAVLSTRLYKSWINLKELYLDEEQFSDVNNFWRGARRTINRFRDARMQIDTFTLEIVCGYERYYDCRRLLLDVSTLGAKEIHIRIRNDNFNFLLPTNLFANDKLTSLSVIGGALYIGYELPISCPSIRTLTLFPTRFIGYRGDLITNYVLRFPCLKSLSCPSFLLFADYWCLGTRSHDLESLTIHNLDYPDNVYFAEVLAFFHRLENLMIKQVLNIGSNLRIYSKSLEHLSIQERFRDVYAILSVPNLKYFHFVGLARSCFTIESFCKDMVSNINVVMLRSNDRWLSSLQKLLHRLSATKIYLSVKMESHIADFDLFIASDSEPINVEVLDLATVYPNYKVLETLFSICLPKRYSYNHDL